MKQKMNSPLMLLALLLSASLGAQSSEKPLAVGIFVYPGVEILDFSGPSEVFAATDGFKPFVVAFKKEPIVAQGFITITPQYSIDDCPATDILVFPGGGTGNVMGEQKMIDWIKERAKTTQIMMSVCTGAGLLSKAGLLENKEVTTFHGYIEELQKVTPSAKVLADTRFVDNGQVVTTAGVSAGIDGALHVVAKIKGEAVAHGTAFYMEYDKWQPKAGKVHEMPFIQDVKKFGIKTAIQHHPPIAGSALPLYYPGELIDLAKVLVETKPAESEAILQHLLATAPSPELYDHLGEFLSKTGKTPPPDSRSFHQKISTGNVAWAKKIHQNVQATQPGWMLFTEASLNQLGYEMRYNLKAQKSEMPQSKYQLEVLELFKWVTELYPNSPNAWDSLAEFYESIGEAAQAISASETCLSKLPGSNFHETEKAQYTSISKERIAKMKQKL